MASFNRKNGLRQVLFSRITLCVLFLVCIYLAFAVFERYQVAKDMTARRVDAQTQYANLLKQKEELEKRVEYLRNDRGIESEIRKYFDVAKEGEQVVIIVEDETEEVQQLPLDSAEESPPWYIFWR